MKECDWDKVPKITIVKWGEDPVESRTRTFNELKKLTLQGLKKHWSRSLNNGLKEGKFLNILDNKYEMDLFPENTSKNTLNNISLLYNTNNNWSRSGNPGFLAKLSYNVGYIKHSNGWGYQYESKEDIEFEETAAHEIGHPILIAYGSSQY